MTLYASYAADGKRFRSARYADSGMRSTPTLDEQLRRRLREAVEKFDGGNADAFGRRIGYMNGGYIREVLAGRNGKRVREKLIDRVHARPEMRGWFSACLPVGPAEAGWPFPGIEPARFVRLSRDQQIEIQGLVRDRIERFEEASGSTGNAKAA